MLNRRSLKNCRYTKWILCSIVVPAVAIVLLLATERNDVQEETLEVTLEETAETTPTETSDNDPEYQIEEMAEIFVYGKRADVTHDGIMDHVVFTIEAPLENDTGGNVHKLLTQIPAEGHVYVYKGCDGKGNYEEEPLWHKGNIHYARVGNVQISVVEKQGKAYLLISNMYVGQGMLEYRYQVLWLDGKGNERIEDEASVEFSIQEFDFYKGNLEEQMPEEAVLLKDFRGKMEAWCGGYKGVLMVATDVSTDPGVFMSQEDSTIYSDSYYKWIWNQWFANEMEPDFMGYADYSGYMDQCKVWTGYEKFVDQDYDGDGLVDRVYRWHRNKVCDYRIQFGNGNEILVEDAALGEPMIQSADLNQDGKNEILVMLTWEGQGMYPANGGNLILFEKIGDAYAVADLPLAEDTDEKWRRGLTINHEFVGDGVVRLTVEETGDQTEVPYQNLEGIDKDFKEIGSVYKAYFTKDEETYLQCMVNMFYWDIKFKLIYKDNQYEIADVHFLLPR